MLNSRMLAGKGLTLFLTRCPERTVYPAPPLSPFEAQIVKLLPSGGEKFNLKFENSQKNQKINRA